MAGVTYLCRAGGYWILRRLPPSPKLQAALTHLPGCLFVAYVAPALLRGQPKDLVGATATVIAMRLSGNIGVAIGVGIATAWAAYEIGRVGL
jgi:uncharacterized membrane protein